MERHDRALLVVYYDLCKHYGFEVPPRWWELQTLPVRENHRAKILWDVPIPTDGEIVARRPDIFLQDKITRHLYLIEMAVAWDSIQEERRAEKQSKYKEVCADLRRQFPGYRMDIVPVVMGGLGTVTHRVGFLHNFTRSSCWCQFTGTNNQLKKLYTPTDVQVFKPSLL